MRKNFDIKFFLCYKFLPGNYRYSLVLCLGRKDRNKSEIIILGAGLPGLSLAYYLKKDYQIYEKNNKRREIHKWLINP